METVEQRARELLASHLDERGYPNEAQNVRDGDEDYENELSLISFLLNTRALSSQPAPVEAREAVGWAVRFELADGVWGTWRVWDFPDRPEKINGWRAEYSPLYLAPPAAAAVDEAMVEAAAWMRDSGDESDDAFVISDKVKRLWLASHPKRVERYTRPLYVASFPHWALPAVESALSMIDLQGYWHSDLAAFRDWLKEKSQ